MRSWHRPRRRYRRPLSRHEARPDPSNNDNAPLALGIAAGVLAAAIGITHLTRRRIPAA